MPSQMQNQAIGTDLQRHQHRAQFTSPVFGRVQVHVEHAFAEGIQLL
jgi:hypothetical protein